MDKAVERMHDYIVKPSSVNLSHLTELRFTFIELT